MNSKKSNIMMIQNKFYESLKKKELMYKELEAKNKNNKEENNINLEFNYPYYIFQEIKKKEKEERKSFPQQNQEEGEKSESNNKKDKKTNDKYNKNIQLIKTNVKYNILYEY